MLTLICRNMVTICSGLYLLIGMTRFSSKWILSHSTWYKFRRSRHVDGGMMATVWVHAPEMWALSDLFTKLRDLFTIKCSIKPRSASRHESFEWWTRRLA